MLQLKKDFKFKKVKNFLDQKETNLLKNYFLIKHRNNDSNFDFRQNDNGETFYYSDTLTESLLKEKKLLVEKETGLELLPSYSYFRLYTMFSTLKKHTDRPACEVSVSVMAGSSGEKWPIFMGGTPVELNPGDAVIYLGCEVEHYREEFLGDWHAQFFLHYVDKNDIHKEHELDGRAYLGAPDHFRKN